MPPDGCGLEPVSAWPPHVWSPAVTSRAQGRAYASNTEAYAASWQPSRRTPFTISVFCGCLTLQFPRQGWRGQARSNPGETVFALGFEGGRALQARGGIVRALHAYDGARVIESTTAFTSGASGGALFDAEGQLVAILTYRLRGDRHSYFSVPIEWFVPRLGADQSLHKGGALGGRLAFLASAGREAAVLPSSSSAGD